MNELIQRRAAMMQSRSGGIDWEQQFADFIGGVYRDIVIPNGVTSIRKYAFHSSRCRTITMPASVSHVGGYALANIGSENVRLDGIVWENPNVELTQINGYVFTATYLSSPNLDDYLPSGCTQIGAGWFANFYNTFAIIPARITSINAANFQYPISGFAGIQFLSTTPPTLLSSNSLGSTSSTWAIYVPDEAVNAYKTASANWQGYASRIKGISEKPT